jgi:predicted DNA-binding ribbon-helix-helix protein
MSSTVPKRSVRIAGHNTSLTLEPEFWSALEDIASARKCSINEIIAHIDKNRAGSLSSALRIFILKEAQKNKVGT